MTPTFLFAGGGTGGHLYPGLAIAERLRETNPQARALFACSNRPLDAEILKTEAADFRIIPAAPFGARPRALARFLSSWGKSVRESRSLIRELRAGDSPVTVLAMGGFVAAPVVQAARVERVPVVLVNLDAVPGLANRWIARHASKVFTTTAARGRDWPVIPPIVRKAACSTGNNQQLRAQLKLSPDRPTLFVTGASQGAQSINRAMTTFARASSAMRDGGWQVIHQTGKFGVEETRAAYADAGIPAVVEAFFTHMGVAWGAADLAISRAGAGSVAEAWANLVPTIFLPYPYHKDEHQKANAEPLVRAGGAILVKDLIDPEATASALASVLNPLLADASQRLAMKAGLETLGPADGAMRLARELLGSNNR